MANFSELSPQKRYQLLLLNEILGIAIVWLNQSTGKPFSQIEEILLDLGEEQVEMKGYRDIRPIINNLDEVYIEF